MVADGRSGVRMIKKITTRIRKTGSNGIFHDSKKDITTLTKVCMELIIKVNELTDEVNNLKKIK